MNYRITGVEDDDLDEIDPNDDFYYVFTLSSFLETLSNCLSLSFAQSVAAPLERMKLVMQCQYALQRGSVIRGLPFETVRSTAVRLWEYEGFEALWRGNGVNLIRAIPTAAVVWLKVGGGGGAGSYSSSSSSSSSSRKRRNDEDDGDGQDNSDHQTAVTVVSVLRNFYYTRQLDQLFDSSVSIIWFLKTWFYATAASALFLTLVYPLEFCRVALATDVITAPNTAYLRVGVRSFPPVRGGNGSGWTCYRDLIRHVARRGAPGGFGLYSGFGSCVASLAVYRAFHLLIHEKISFFSGSYSSSSSSSSSSSPTSSRSSSASAASASSSLFGSWMRAWVVCTSAGFVAYPLDTVSRWCVVDMALSKKQQHQQQQHTSHFHKSNPVKLAKEAFKTGGIRIFYHGAMVNVARNAVVMSVLHSGIWNSMIGLL